LTLPLSLAVPAIRDTAAICPLARGYFGAYLIVTIREVLVVIREVPLLREALAVIKEVLVKNVLSGASLSSS